MGRDAELERLRRCVRQEPGTPSALVLLGEEGIGKTRLLRAAGEYAAGAGGLVLSAQGWAAERERPFGCLRHLLAPLTDRIPALAEPHHTVLRTVIGLEPGGAVPSGAAVRSAGSALLDQLGRPGQVSPTGRVLVTVDDAHDCDTATLELLGSLARRTGVSRISLLLASRAGELLLGLPSDVEILHVAPLSPRESAELLERLPGAPGGRRRLELLDEAQGNPSALLELCRLRASSEDPIFAHEHPPRLQHLGSRFEALLGLLPSQTQQALAVAALALPGDDAAAVMAALGTSDLEVWAPAEEAGIVALTDGRIVFRHPLARVAASFGQPALLRHRAHRALAELAAARPLDRARHLAAATLGPDASVARTLQVAAGSSPDDFTAARALDDAAQLSTAAEERARRLAEALAAALAVGDPGWVHDLHARFACFDTDPRLWRGAALAAAEALSQTGRQREAFGLLLDTAEQVPPEDVGAAAELAAAGAAIAQQSGLAEHRGRLSALLASATDAAPGPEERRDDGTARTDAAEDTASLAAFVQAVSDIPGSARRSLRRLNVPRPDGLLDEPTRLTPRVAVASVAYHADEPDVCLEQYRAVELRFRSRRAFGHRARYLAPMLDTLLATGRWTEADTLLDESLDKAALLRLPRLRADLEALHLSLRALRGMTPAAPSHPDPRPWIDLRENAATRARVVRAGALVALSRGDWADAFRRLRTLFDENGAALHPFHSRRSIAELALTGHRAGNVEEAARILARVRDSQGERPTTRMTLLLHHAAALVDPGADPEHQFRLALVNAEGERWPVERAQARLSYAIWLRRARRPSEARQQLAAALETVELLGAECVATGIRHELRASGVATPPDSAGALAQLTAQQRQIIRMAAEGLSNREIGEQLFLSPRTVGTHLYNVYPKLGVTRRHQLRDLLRDR